MTVVDVSRSVVGLADRIGGSVDAVTGAAIGPYRKSRVNEIRRPPSRCPASLALRWRTRRPRPPLPLCDGGHHVLQYFYYAQLPSGWTTIVILIAGFNGIQLIFMGIIGEYIVEEQINFTRDRAEQARAR
jgi:hypothetical protein